MREFLLSALVVLLTPLLWYGVVELVARLFGVSIFPRLWRHERAVRPLTFSQHMGFVGVLAWGGGVFFATTLLEYLEWKYWGAFHGLSANRMLLKAVVWLTAGLLFGWMTWKCGSDKTS